MKYYEILTYLTLKDDIIDIIDDNITTNCFNCNQKNEILENNTKFCINCNLVYIKNHPVYDLYYEDMLESDMKDEMLY